MEIKELVSYYLNDTSKTLEVTFRTTLDGEDEIREDKINFNEITDFGYDFVSNIEGNYRELLDEDYEDDDYEDDEIFVDDQEVTSFLNEYYLIYPTKLPNSELFEGPTLVRYNVIDSLPPELPLGHNPDVRKVKLSCPSLIILKVRTLELILNWIYPKSLGLI